MVGLPRGTPKAEITGKGRYRAPLQPQTRHENSNRLHRLSRRPLGANRFLRKSRREPGHQRRLSPDLRLGFQMILNGAKTKNMLVPNSFATEDCFRSGQAAGTVTRSSRLPPRGSA